MEEPTAFAVPPSQWAISDEDPSDDPAPPPPSAVGSPKEGAPLETQPLLGGGGPPPRPSAPPYPSPQAPYVAPLPSAQAPYAPPPPHEPSAPQAPYAPPPPPAWSEGPAVKAATGFSGWCFSICLANAAAAALLVCLATGAAGPSRAAALGGAFAAAYAAYLALCFCSPSGRALRNVMDQAELDAYVRRLRSAAPVVEASITCYHYETRRHTEHYTDKEGHRRHRHVSTTVRVNTHSAREQWRYSWCRDVSGPPVHRPKISALRVKIKAVQDFTGAASRAAFDGWREGFFRRNTMDVHQERTCRMTVPGLEGYSYVMLRREKGGALSAGAHCMAAMLLCGGLYEAAVLGEVPTTKWLLVKQLHA